MLVIIFIIVVAFILFAVAIMIKSVMGLVVIVSIRVYFGIMSVRMCVILDVRRIMCRFFWYGGFDSSENRRCS